MRIQHNIMAMGAYRNYTNNVNAMKKNLEKLSSGYKINRAGDDAAGLAISEKMRAQITGLETAQKNAKDGISLVQTAEGALTEVHDMLNRMVTLATQSANGTYDNDVDRVQLQKELDQLRTEIDRIADSSNFNGIKLFDGSLSDAELTTDGVVASSKSVTDGLTINDGTDGGGTKAEASIDVTSLFGTGDTLAIEFTDTGLGTGGTKTLSFGTGATDIKGDTLEEQAKSIRDALSSDAAISQKFDIGGESTQITLTAKNEGATEPAVKKITVGDKTVKFGVKNDTNSKPGAPGTATLAGDDFANLFGNKTTGNGTELNAGDQLRFNFEGANGEKLVAELTVTDDMIDTLSIEKTTENIVNALKDTYFTDVTSANAADLGATAGTVADESRFKVSDLFTLTANQDKAAASTGSIKVDGTKAGAFAAKTVDIKRPSSTGSEPYASWTAISTDTTPTTAGTNATTDPKPIYAIDAGSENFTAGDKIEITGMLSDGRTFNATLIAGEDFDIGTSYPASATNIQNALKSADLDVKIGDQTVKANEIFAADNSKEIQVGGTAGALTFTSAKAGTISEGIAGGILAVSCTPAEKAGATTKLTQGTDPSAAESSFTFSEGVGYGTAITVDGKTYELVKDARDVTNRSNEAVVMTDLSDLSAVASAFADSINRVAQEKAGTGNTPDYTATADGATVKITTSDTGSDVKAMAITTPYGDDVPTLEFTFDPKKVQAGSTITIKTGDDEVGKTYEFVKTGEKAKSGNIAIEVADFDKATAKSLGDAFAKVAQGITPEVADDGKVTITANEVDGKIPSLSAKFSNGKAGLKLQIGDTADEYNQMKVSIYKMKCADMGIGNISILDQDSAGAAIDKIRSAINYVSDVRGTLGATQNRLDHTINNLSVMQENIQDAESTIRDTDVAAEMMAYTKNNILIQSAQAMLAQANQVPQGVLQLLQ